MFERLCPSTQRGRQNCETGMKRVLLLNVFSSYSWLLRALEQARIVDKKRAKGERLGSLAGIPIAVKDNLCVRGSVTTAGSRILENFVAPYDATSVARLIQEVRESETGKRERERSAKVRNRKNY